MDSLADFTYISFQNSAHILDFFVFDLLIWPENNYHQCPLFFEKIPGKSEEHQFFQEYISRILTRQRGSWNELLQMLTRNWYHKEFEML